MNSNFLFLLLALISQLTASAATLVRIKTATMAGTVLQDLTGTALDGGGPSDGDGALLEFGYYSLATDALPFAGIWTPLTGPHSVSLITTTVGDGFAQDGVFTLAFELSTALAGLPTDGTPLAMRFYDSTTRAVSTDYNAVAKTDSSWDWSGTGSQINMLVGTEPATVWQDGTGSAFRTTIPVPEPSGALMVLGGAAAWCLRRRK
ncbi:MAG: PEP-CTERM sorting domain-containing protein [Akkermansiaceae bacterium]|jgi:hypothetical protein|nr:PEP-CTERM sorting domain-containing protein [Akkermansiaceae bacterium]